MGACSRSAPAPGSRSPAIPSDVESITAIDIDPDSLMRAPEAAAWRPARHGQRAGAALPRQVLRLRHLQPRLLQRGRARAGARGDPPRPPRGGRAAHARARTRSLSQAGPLPGRAQSPLVRHDAGGPHSTATPSRSFRPPLRRHPPRPAARRAGRGDHRGPREEFREPPVRSPRARPRGLPVRDGLQVEDVRVPAARAAGSRPSRCGRPRRSTPPPSFRAAPPRPSAARSSCTGMLRAGSGWP